MTERTRSVWYSTIITALERVVSRPRPAKTHNFSDHLPGEFAFDRVGENQAYMTGQKHGVLRGDYILLEFEQKTELYQIQTLDYYASPPDMWMALLLKVDAANRSRR